MRPTVLLPLLVLGTAVTGCRSYHQVVPHDTAVLMADEGQLKTLRPVDIEYSPPFSSRHVKDTYLIPDQVRKFDKDNADWAVSFTPAWNRSAAWDAARWISHGQPSDLTRWAISGNPTVVALGPHPANAQPGGIRPVTLNDLENRVVRLLVLDTWQAPPKGAIQSPPPGVRTIDLPDQPTLRELFQRAPWAAPAP